MMQLADYKWYAVMTNSRAEQEAKLDIGRLGYSVLYLHTMEEVGGSSKRKTRLVKRPYLPRYIFVGLKPDQFVDGVPTLHEISKARGVSAVVHSPGGDPLPIPLRAMELVTRKAELPGGLVWSRKSKPAFAGLPGDTIKLSEASAYAGLMAVIMSIDPKHEIIVEIESFGRKVPARIGLEHVDVLFDKSGTPVDKVRLPLEP